MAEAPVTNPDGEVVATHFPDVKIYGGPLGRDIDLEVDGQKPPKVFRLELDADVSDVVRMTTHQFVALADVQLQVGGWERKFVADVRVHPGPPGEPTLEEPIKIEGKGDNAIEALEDAVRQLKEREA